MRTSCLGIVALLTVAGCAEQDYVVDVGVIDAYGDTAQIEVPASASVGERITVAVTTLGYTCTELDSTDVVVHGDVVDLTPYDRMPTDVVCVALRGFVRHDAKLTFDTAGEKTVRVHGRRLAARTDEEIVTPVSIVVE